MSGGALGMGLSFCLGQALAARIDGAPWRCYCLLGDGELNEGQNWEAAMAAAHFELDGVTAASSTATASRTTARRRRSCAWIRWPTSGAPSAGT